MENFDGIRPGFEIIRSVFCVVDIGGSGWCSSVYGVKPLGERKRGVHGMVVGDGDENCQTDDGV